MRSGLLAFALAVPAAWPAVGQQLAPTTLERLKAGTVFVVTENGSGSGFLFRKSGTTLHIMTCEHVVGDAATVSVVFHSGQRNELKLQAEVVATDPDRDLACLRVTDAKDAPAVLALASQTTVKETETLFASGFPFGGRLAADIKNPEIAVSRSSVSSIRRDNAGRVVAVQLSGEVHPGNSGGPLVDSAGKVVGVVRSKIFGTGTAFAVPPEEVAHFLRGRVKSAAYTPQPVSATETKVEVAVTLIDPLGALKNVGLYWVRADKAPPVPAEPPKDGWGKLGGSPASVSLKSDGPKAVGSFSVRRASSDPVALTLLVQPHYTTAGGDKVHLHPLPLEVIFDAPMAEEKPIAPKDAPAPVKPKTAVAVESVVERDEQGRSYVRVVADATKINLGPKLLQVVASPSGGAVYAIYADQAVVKMFDPETWTVVKEMTTPKSPVSLWCDEKRVAVACLESKVVTFLDPAAGRPVKSVPVRDAGLPEDFGPVRVVGRGPDGSLLTLWHSPKTPRWDTWLYHVSESGTAKRILKGDLQHVCYLQGTRTLLGQRNFRGSPSGVASMFDVPAAKELPTLHTHPLFGRVAGWHRSFAHMFKTHDGRHLVLPTSQIESNYGYQTRTYVADLELKRFVFDFPGVAFAEVPSEGLLISWGLTYKDQKEIGPEIFYASRSNGRVVRRISIKGLSLHPAGYLYVNPNPSVLYLPGHEVAVVRSVNDSAGEAFLVRCGPVDPKADVGADPGLVVKNDPPAKAVVGKEVVYAPSFERPATSKSIVFKLKKGPEEIRIDAATGRMTWTPSDAYVGKFDLAVVAVIDGAEVPVVAWTIEVGF